MASSPGLSPRSTSSLAAYPATMPPPKITYLVVLIVHARVLDLNPICHSNAESNSDSVASDRYPTPNESRQAIPLHAGPQLWPGLRVLGLDLFGYRYCRRTHPSRAHVCHAFHHRRAHHVGVFGRSRTKDSLWRPRVAAIRNYWEFAADGRQFDAFLC